MMNAIFKKALVVMVILFGVAVSLPRINLTIGENAYTIDTLNVLAEKYGSQVGNFKRGYGLYPSKKVTARIDYKDEGLTDEAKEAVLNDYLTLVRKRVDFSGLYDIRVSSEIKEGEYTLVFDYPEYFSESEKYTGWLISKGEIGFISAQQTAVNLYDYEIEGAIVLDYLDYIGNHLAFSFNRDALTKLPSAFISGTQDRYFLMTVDSNPSYFIIEYDQYADTNDTSVRAIPTQYVPLNSVGEIVDFLNITRSYFLQEKPLENSFTILNEVTETVAPTYSDQSGSITAFSFMIFSFVLLVLAFVRYKKEGAIKFTLMYSSFVFLLTALLKISSAHISVPFLLGFLLMTFVATGVIFDLLEQRGDLKRKLQQLQDLSLFIFIVGVLVVRLVPGLGGLNDLLGVLINGAIVLFICALFNFKVITSNPSEGEEDIA